MRRTLFGLLAVAALGAVPASAQLQGECRGGACADGYRGCGCDASCCERRLRGKAGTASAGFSGSGYSPEMATMNVIMNFYQTFSAMQTQQQQRQAVAEEQRRVEQMQARIRAAEEEARRRAEDEQRRDALAKEFKGDAPDLSRPPELKMDEPVRRPKPKADPDALCRESLPHAVHAPGDTEARWEAKQLAYLPRLAQWEKSCGSGDGADLIGKASFGRVGALIAYESRLWRLMNKPSPTRADIWEMNRLLEAGEGIQARLTPAEKTQLLDYEETVEAPRRTIFDPPETEGGGLLETLETRKPGLFPQPPSLSPGKPLLAAIEGLDAVVKKGRAAMPRIDMDKEIIPASKLPRFGGGEPGEPAKEWTVGGWLKAKKEEGQREIHRLVAELGGGGMQNEEDYSK